MTNTPSPDEDRELIERARTWTVYDDADSMITALADRLESLLSDRTKLELQVQELEAAEAVRKRHAAEAWRYYHETNCACTAAERYVPTCEKHGINRSTDR